MSHPNIIRYNEYYTRRDKMRNRGKWMLTLSFTALLLVMFFGCKGGAGVKGEKEPNNTIDKACEITLGQPFSITIKPEGDMDWFKVKLPEQGYLRVQANGIPEELGLECSFALYEEWEGKKEKRLRDWHKFPDALFVSKAGTYYFLIHDDYDDKTSNKTIQIKADFLKEFDPTEPNNKPEEATLVEFGSDIKTAVYPVGDQDWLKVKAEKQGYLSIKSKETPEGITPEVRYSIFDEWADPKTKEIRNWEKLSDACFIPKAGYYFIQLHDDYDDAASETPYDLRIEFIEEMDEYEPNDDFKEAKSVKRGDIIKAAIFPTDDRDYYKIDVAQGNKIKFMAKDFSDIVPEIRLFVLNKENPNELTEFSDWEKLPAELDVEEGRKYFILLHDDYDDASSPKPFEISIE